MKNRLRDVLLTVVVLLLASNMAVQVLGGVREAKALGKTTYKIVELSKEAGKRNHIELGTDDIQKVFDKYANDGWEFVGSAVPMSDWLVFKK
ncbi:MAG: hypothetical protein U0610_17935 [bacterium]